MWALTATSWTRPWMQARDGAVSQEGNWGSPGDMPRPQTRIDDPSTPIMVCFYTCDQSFYGLVIKHPYHAPKSHNPSGEQVSSHAVLIKTVGQGGRMAGTSKTQVLYREHLPGCHLPGWGSLRGMRVAKAIPMLGAKVRTTPLWP